MPSVFTYNSSTGEIVGYVVNGSSVIIEATASPAAVEEIRRQLVGLRHHSGSPYEVRVGAPGEYREAHEEERRRAEEAQRLAKEREILRQAAEEKAVKTLRRMLSPAQLKTMDSERYIPVKGSAGNNYRISVRGGYSGNITWVDGQGTLGCFCCHATLARDLEGTEEWMPSADQFLAQKLMLETDELGFLRTTVINGGSLPRVVRDNHADRLPQWQRCRCRDCHRNGEY